MTDEKVSQRAADAEKAFQLGVPLVSTKKAPSPAELTAAAEFGFQAGGEKVHPRRIADYVETVEAERAYRLKNLEMDLS